MASPGSAQPRSLFDLQPPSSKEGYYQWMWADVEELGDHELAEADPFRWSDWLNAAGTIADLEAYKAQSPRNQLRPVELMKGGGSQNRGLALARPMKFGNIDEAIAYLGAQTTTPPPQVVEKTERVAVPGHCEGASALTSSEALCFMALGSALTLAAYAMYHLCACTVRRFRHGGKGEMQGLLNGSDSEDEAKPRLAALTDARAPQPYGGVPVLQESELRALLADIEEEERLMLTAGPRSLRPGSQSGKAPTKDEALFEVERVLSAKSAKEIFGGGGANEQRACYRRLVRLLHPDKKVVEGQRASLALRRVVECYRALAEGS